MKPITEYNGIESYVHELILQDDIAWLPVDRSLVLEKRFGIKKNPMNEIESLNNLATEVMRATLHLP